MGNYTVGGTFTVKVPLTLQSTDEPPTLTGATLEILITNVSVPGSTTSIVTASSFSDTTGSGVEVAFTPTTPGRYTAQSLLTYPGNVLRYGKPVGFFEVDPVGV